MISADTRRIQSRLFGNCAPPSCRTRLLKSFSMVFDSIITHRLPKMSFSCNVLQKSRIPCGRDCWRQVAGPHFSCVTTSREVRAMWIHQSYHDFGCQRLLTCRPCSSPQRTQMVPPAWSSPKGDWLCVCGQAKLGLPEPLFLQATLALQRTTRMWCRRCPMKRRAGQ